MKSTKAYAPANISFAFKVVPDPDPAIMGSLGVGCTVDQGVIAEATKANKTNILLNGTPILLPTVDSVITKLTGEPVKITLSTTLPLGSGFGISGASALASALAINTLLGLKKSRLDLAKIAHVAEVENKTGLGDIVNQYIGGCLVKFVPSSQFKAVRIPLTGKTIYCISLGKLMTSSILKSPQKIERINKAADQALQSVQRMLRDKSVTLSLLLDISLAFSRSSGLLASADVIKLIDSIKLRGGHASMIMLGMAVASDIPFDGARQLRISDNHAHLVG